MSGLKLNNISKKVPEGVSVTLTKLFIYKLFNCPVPIKYKYFNIRAKYFLSDFKIYISHSTQKLPLRWEIRFYKMSNNSMFPDLINSDGNAEICREDNAKIMAADFPVTSQNPLVLHRDWVSI